MKAHFKDMTLEQCKELYKNQFYFHDLIDELYRLNHKDEIIIILFVMSLHDATCLIDETYSAIKKVAKILVDIGKGSQFDELVIQIEDSFNSFTQTKKELLSLFSIPIDSLDPQIALKVINHLVRFLNYREIVIEIEQKRPNHWNAIIKKYLNHLENFKRNQIEYVKYEIVPNDIESFPVQQTNATEKAKTKTEQHYIEIKPTLKPEAVEPLFNIIKDFFSPEQQNELKQLLETWDNVSNKLLFKDNGNRLSDTFKKLIEHNLITGCEKQDLINWIILNFSYTYRKKVKAFIYDTVEKIISRNDSPCKSPLIEIKNGQIQKVEKPRTKKSSKH